jgi:sugar phosphate isomerase/epimerase
MKPKLAVTNIFEEITELKAFANEHALQGIDWSFDLDDLPGTPMEESRWVREQALLAPFEVRYHCPFYRIDLGHDDPVRAGEADAIFRRIIRLVSKAGGKYLTIHIGLGRNSTEPLSWDTTIENLRRLVQFGGEHGVRVCLENLAWGWTSRPNLFEKLVRKSGAGVTLDIGHAHACESVRTQQYSFEDFVTPHPDRVFNAHVYHTEISGRGHMPPQVPEDIRDRLSLLLSVRCNWWVIEIKDPKPLLGTLRIIKDFLEQQGGPDLSSEEAL